MKKTERAVVLSLVEWRHILRLLDGNEQDGTYFGNKEQYWNRHYKVADILERALSEPAK